MEEKFLQTLVAVTNGSMTLNDAEAIFRAHLATLTQKQKDRALAEVSNTTGRVSTLVVRLHACFREAMR